MKKLYSLVAVLILIPVTVGVYAMFAVYNQALPGVPATSGYTTTNGGNAAVATTFTLPLNQLKADYDSFQIKWSTFTPANQTFTDGSKSTATITVNSSVALANQFLYINSIQVPFTWITTSSGTAVNICNGINNTTALSSIVTCSTTTAAINSVVAATATAAGFNYTIYTSTPNALEINGSTSTQAGSFTSGTLPSYSSGTATIALSGSPSWPVGFQILFSTGNVAIAGLSNFTTYYWIPTVSGFGQLASSAANAQAGTGIKLTSIASNVGNNANTFTLAPLAYTGSAAGSWQVSNDGVNWGVWASSSGAVSLIPANPAVPVYIDPGLVDYSYIRFNLSTPPTTGAINLTIIPNAKKINSD